MADSLGDRHIVSKPNIARADKAIANRQELQQLKRDINLVDFAIAKGYVRNAKKSTAQSIRLEHPNGDRIIVKPDSQGFDTYFSPQNSSDNGTIIDFIQQRQAASLGEIRQLLKRHLGEFAHRQDRRIAKSRRKFILPHHLIEKSAAIEKKAAKTFTPKNYPALKSHSYLEQRGISSATLKGDRFSGQVLGDERNNVVFPYRDSSNITGYELRNHDFKGFGAGGKKSLWLSNQGKGDQRLVIVESPIDALSHYQLHPNKYTRYIATGGTISQRQKELIKAEITGIIAADGRVIFATDNDSSGDKLADELKKLLPEKPRFRDSRSKPKLKDWNEDLVARLEKMALNHGTKDKARNSKGIEL